MRLLMVINFLRYHPMVTCEIRSVKIFVNLDGVTGLVVAPDCSVILAIAMKILQSSKEISKQHGDKNPKKYLDLFSGAQFGKSYAKFFGSVL